MSDYVIPPCEQENCVRCGKYGPDCQCPSELAASRGSALSSDAEKAMLKDRYGPKVRPIAYVCHLPRITALAREYGYAIGVHGSLQRDLDLIAVPWSEVASEPDELIVAICQTAGAFIIPGQDAATKPHGRKAWVLQLGAGLYIDISVMPKAPNDQAHRPEAAKCT